MSTNKAKEILKRNAEKAKSQRERNREILAAWNKNMLDFMDEMKVEFDAKVVSIWCEVKK